jgi:hypothetical protein
MRERDRRRGTQRRRDPLRKAQEQGCGEQGCHHDAMIEVEAAACLVAPRSSSSSTLPITVP